MGKNDTVRPVKCRIWMGWMWRLNCNYSRIMRIFTWSRLGAFLAGGLAVWGQTTPEMLRLSTAAGGMAVYATTNLTMRGETADKLRKVVKWDTGQWGTAMRDVSGAWTYERIQEDNSGAIQIYTRKLVCPSCQGIIAEVAAGVVMWRNRDTGVEWQVGWGTGSVSDNGEWVVTATDVPDSGVNSLGIRRIRLMDGRVEQATVYTSPANLPVRRMVADDGTIVIGSYIWRPDADAPENAKLSLTPYVVDPAGEFALGVGSTTSTDTLYSLNLSTKELTSIEESTAGIEQPDLASDRHTAVFISGADWEGKNPDGVKQVWLKDLWTGERRQLTTETANVADISLAHDATAVFAATENLRVVRIDLITGEVQEIAPAYPRILARDPLTDTWAHGGLYWLWGRGFGDSEITAGGKAVTVTAESTDDVEFLVPDDAEVGSNQVRVGSKGSPFQPADTGYTVVEVMPAFIGSGGRSATWLHADGVTEVTDDNPAQLGETITARMTGMGPVDASGATTLSFNWTFHQYIPTWHGQPMYWSEPLTVISSRASGTAGLYLVTVTLPQTVVIDPSVRREIIVNYPGQAGAVSPALPLKIE